LVHGQVSEQQCPFALLDPILGGAMQTGCEK